MIYGDLLFILLIAFDVFCATEYSLYWLRCFIVLIQLEEIYVLNRSWKDWYPHRPAASVGQSALKVLI